MRPLLPLILLALLLPGCDKPDSSSQPPTQQSQPAASQPGVSKYRYVADDGGPYLLLPSEVTSFWKSPTPMDVLNPLNPKSDYGRACAAVSSAPFALIPVGPGSALVLADPPLSSWSKSQDGFFQIYDFQSFTTPNVDALIDAANASLTPASFTDSGKSLILHTPGAHLLFAGDSLTSPTYGVLPIPLPPAHYHILTANYQSKGNSLTIYRLAPQP